MQYVLFICKFAWGTCLASSEQMDQRPMGFLQTLASTPYLSLYFGRNSASHIVVSKDSALSLSLIRRPLQVMERLH